VRIASYVKFDADIFIQSGATGIFISHYLQELSYRKQLARQLRTQFVEGISVTLKSTLRVTQGHWKRNHWTDHTRLTIIDELLDIEYYRDLEMWVRGHSRSLKVVLLESLGTVS